MYPDYFISFISLNEFIMKRPTAILIAWLLLLLANAAFAQYSLDFNGEEDHVVLNGTDM